MRVEPFAGDGDALLQLVTDWPYKPYRWAGVPQGAVDSLAMSRLSDSLHRPGVWSGVTRVADAPISGLATLEALPWDSRILGMSAARVDFVVPGPDVSRRARYEALLDAALIEARVRKYEHLSVRVDAGDVAAIQTLEACGWLSVDSLLTFESEARAGVGARRREQVVTRAACASDTAVIESIAAESFVDGRFHSDPSISSDVATSIYREWASSCCRRDAADDVTVAETRSGQIVGFVACRVVPETGVHLGRLTASIVLIATASAARGRGVGSALVMAAVEWAVKRSAITVQVATQIRNTTAARLYEQCGFRLVGSSQSFRAVVSR